MDSLMHGNNEDQPHLIFDMPTNGLDFDDFHPYPLTFRDELSTQDAPHLSQEEVNPRDEDTESDDDDSDDTDSDDVN